MKTKQFAVILPVMFGFFIMGFVDIIGMTINYASADFSNVGAGLVSLLASSLFVWFILASVPTGLMMNRIGRKNTVMLSFLIQIIAFSLVTFFYSIPVVFIAFSLLGIGNTILQVAMNPLVSDVVSQEKLTGTMTIGQLVKAVCSLASPLLVSWFAAGTAGNWKLIFPVYAVISLVGLVWLFLTPVKEAAVNNASQTTFGTTFKLLSDSYILRMFIGILVLVGADVGINTTYPKLLQESCAMTLNEAAAGNSVYFLARTVGALIGGILLMKFPEGRIYKASIIIALCGLLGLVFAQSRLLSFAAVVVFGLGYSNLFAIIFSMAIKHNPAHSNDISALLVMGVAGGGILPPVMAAITGFTGNQWSAILVIVAIWLYLFTLIKQVCK